jgi:hypothetical protein
MKLGFSKIKIKKRNFYLIPRVYTKDCRREHSKVVLSLKNKEYIFKIGKV